VSTCEHQETFWGWGRLADRRVSLTTLPSCVSLLSIKCGNLYVSQPYGPPRPVTGIAFLSAYMWMITRYCFIIPVTWYVNYYAEEFKKLTMDHNVIEWLYTFLSEEPNIVDVSFLSHENGNRSGFRNVVYYLFRIPDDGQSPKSHSFWVSYAFARTL
jgi:hypothetical protein